MQLEARSELTSRPKKVLHSRRQSRRTGKSCSVTASGSAGSFLQWTFQSDSTVRSLNGLLYISQRVAKILRLSHICSVLRSLLWSPYHAPYLHSFRFRLVLDHQAVRTDLAMAEHHFLDHCEAALLVHIAGSRCGGFEPDWGIGFCRNLLMVPNQLWC